jgi:uncharacterized membrane protein YgdD (TMEM256/DUF423 family)
MSRFRALPGNRIAAIAAVSGFIGVAMGAFAAHGLKARIAAELLAVFQTGVQYQLWHTFALLAIASQSRPQTASRWLGWSAWAMIAGMLMFSGSLYALALTGERWLGMITPFGGLCFLTGWLLLAIHFLRAARFDP